MKNGLVYRLYGVFALCIAFFVVVSVMTPPAEAVDFKSGYSLTGNAVEKMVSIAQTQTGRTGRQMGYNGQGAWCAMFVSDVAKLAGESNAIPYNKGCGDLWRAVIKAGGREVKSPQKGDLVFFYCYTCLNYGDGKPYCHVAIMKDTKTCISGNWGDTVATHSINSYYDEYNHAVGNDISPRYLRPAYKNSSVQQTEPDYFDCDVQIELKKGKTVDLYAGLFDTQRTDYMDQGQTVRSRKCAKFSDGSTWYQFNATQKSNGKTYEYWLKYDSGKMSLTDLNKTASVNAAFDVSSISLDLVNNKSQKVTLTVGGDIPSGCKLLPSIGKSNDSVASVTWEQDSNGLYPTITAKSVGNTTLTCKILTSDEKTVLATATLAIKVSEPTYQIKYDANGGSGAPAAQTKKHGRALTLSDQRPTRDGYTFVGWASAEEVTQVFAAGSTYTIDGNITLYAVWEEITKPSYIPDGAVEFNGHYYYLYDNGKQSWEDALDYCKSVNGYLATITSREENDFLYQYMKNCGYRSAYFGLTDANHEGSWEWCTGEAVVYSNWNAAEPNNDHGTENYGMFLYKYRDGTWNDGDFGRYSDGGTAYLCEWGDEQVTWTPHTYIPDGAVEFNGHYYYLYDNGKQSWEDALDYCKSVNGYLATITSREENDFLYQYMKNCGYKSAYFGLTDANHEGSWEWCTGEAVSFTNWHVNEPSNSGGTEDYGMFYDKYSDGTWNDGEFKGQATKGLAYLCEWGGN